MLSKPYQYNTHTHTHTHNSFDEIDTRPTEPSLVGVVWRSEKSARGPWGAAWHAQFATPLLGPVSTVISSTMMEGITLAGATVASSRWRPPRQRALTNHLEQKSKHWTEQTSMRNRVHLAVETTGLCGMLVCSCETFVKSACAFSIYHTVTTQSRQQSTVVSLCMDP